MRGLKALVIILGVLLVGGTVTLIGAMIWRGSHPLGTGAVGRSAGTARPAFATTLDLPSGATVLSAQADGGRLVLRLGLPDGRQQLVIIDEGSGARLGTIELRPAQ
jgi:hypothetical protein